jgi:undecaprenyl-diphosphatase
MNLLQIAILAIVQGLAELLPVSSSAHVVVAEKLMGLNPSSPEMTLVLVMLHTGTMFAVIVYFWQRWKLAYFRNADTTRQAVIQVAVATAITGIVGEGIIKVIEKLAFHGVDHAQIEDLFSHLEWIAPALFVAGVLIMMAGITEARAMAPVKSSEPTGLNTGQAARIGLAQGFCLPFRGFSRSGATISTGMLARVSKDAAENFSFALAVVLTPPVVARELWRLIKAKSITDGGALGHALVPGLVGAALSFVAGLVALKWLSRWLEGGRWYLFGVYCLIASLVVFLLYRSGF